MTIARRFGVPVIAVLEANPGVDRYALRVGQAVRIPILTATPTPTRTPTAAASGTSTPDFIIYRIQPGDVFMTIADRFGVPVIAVLEANPGVDRYALRVGQAVRIPVLTATPVVGP